MIQCTALRLTQPCAHSPGNLPHESHAPSPIHQCDVAAHKLFSLEIRLDRHITRVSTHVQLLLAQPSYQSLSCLHVDWPCSCRGSAEHSTAFELHAEPCTRLLLDTHRQS